MKRALSILLAAVLLLSVFAGCTGKDEPAEVEPEVVSDTTVEPEQEPEPPKPNVYDDGRARPSNCGNLQVINGKLCSESGEPVILRGVSSYGLITAENMLNEPLFEELSRDRGVNVFRLAMYTHGVGTIGYCTKGDRERHLKDISDGVEFATNQDMYVLIDWHILSDGDPNQYIDKASEFFALMAETYCDYNNVIYEICNEPNGVEWPAVKEYANTIIPIIRERDPNSVIIVGTPDYSSRIADAAADPLDFDNILYAYHFYSASHTEESREKFDEVASTGFPIFVTEYGITNCTGGVPRDIESADKWIELLEKYNVSYCMWSFSNVAEASAAIKRDCFKHNGLTDEDFSPTGIWLMNNLAAHTGLHGDGMEEAPAEAE